jgi:NhaP-type Na+/H+ or K+/H+ antiporter
MNDGSAFPFVLLGLGMLGLGDDTGGHYTRWLLVDVLWSTSARWWSVCWPAPAWHGWAGNCA